MSETLWEIIFFFIGTKKIVKGEIERHKIPQTFEVIRDKTREKGFFTVRSRGNLGSPKTYWMLLIGIKRGGEKQRLKEFNIGDIVYCPRQDALFLIYEKSNFSYPVYYFGKITEGIEYLPSFKNGTMVRIQLKDIT